MEDAAARPYVAVGGGRPSVGRDPRRRARADPPLLPRSGKAFRMSSMRSRLVKRVALLAGATAALAVAAAGALYALIEWASLPLADGASLSSGAVRVVVTDRWGPIRIAAYIVALDDGGVALVDTGMDPEADALLAALAADG